VTQDIADFINEARKYGIASAFAHQERFGQLKDNLQVMGATLAAAIEIFFQLTVRDSQELAPEIAPSVEAVASGREAELIISPHAVEDLWERGHPDPQLLAIRNRYFWLVDLLKTRSEDNYFHVDPARCKDLDFAEYDD